MTLVPLTKHRTVSPSRHSVFGGGIGDFDRIFDNFFRNAMTNVASGTATPSSVTDMAVKMDIMETGKAYHLEVDLPGMEEKDIDLNVSDGLLTLSGERVSSYEEDGEDNKVHRVERTYGAFKRAIQLPADADEDKIEARMKNGVLLVEIRKLKEAVKEPKKINIRKE